MPSEPLASTLDALAAWLGSAGAWVAAAVAMLAIAALVVAFWLRPRDARVRVGRVPPPLVAPNRGQADWAQARVHKSPLRISYQDHNSIITERMVRPRLIRGQKVSGRVRPETLHAYCELRQATRNFRYDGILWAADARSGELIDDLYTYLGSAQPGGALAPAYQTSAAPDAPRQWKRHPTP